MFDRLRDGVIFAANKKLEVRFMVEYHSTFLSAKEVRALITALEPYAAPKPVPLSNADTKFYAHIFDILTQERRTSGHFGRRAADRVQPDRRANCGRRASDCSRGGSGTPQTECAQWAHAAGVWEHNANQYKKDAEEASTKIAEAVKALSVWDGSRNRIPAVDKALAALVGRDEANRRGAQYA